MFDFKKLGYQAILQLKSVKFTSYTQKKLPHSNNKKNTGIVVMSWALSLELRYRNRLAPPPQSHTHSESVIGGESCPQALIWLSSKVLKHGDRGPTPAFMLKLIHGDVAPSLHSGYKEYNEEYVYRVDLILSKERLASKLDHRVTVGVQVYAHSRNQDGDGYHAPAGVALVSLPNLWRTRRSGRWHSHPLYEHIDGPCATAHLPSEAQGSASDSDTDFYTSSARPWQESTIPESSYPEYARPPQTFLKGEIDIRIVETASLPKELSRVVHNKGIPDNESVKKRMRDLIFHSMDDMYNSKFRPLSSTIESIQCPTYASTHMPLPGGAWALVLPPLTASPGATTARAQVLYTLLRTALYYCDWTEEKFIAVVEQQLAIVKENRLVSGFTQACEILAYSLTFFSNSLPYSDDVLDARRWTINREGKLTAITPSGEPTISADKYMDIRKLFGGDCDDVGHGASALYWELTRADLGSPPQLVAVAKRLAIMCYMCFMPHEKVSTASASQQQQQLEQSLQRGVSRADQPGINHICGILLPVASVVHWWKKGLSLSPKSPRMPAQLLKRLPYLSPKSEEYRPWLYQVQPLALEGTGLLPPCMLPRQLWPDEECEVAKRFGEAEAMSSILRKGLEQEIPELKDLKRPLDRPNQGSDFEDLQLNATQQPFYKIAVGFFTYEFSPHPYGLHNIPAEDHNVVSGYFLAKRAKGRPEEKISVDEWSWGVGVNTIVLSGIDRETFDSIAIVPDVVLTRSEMHAMLDVLDQEPPVPLLQPPVGQISQHSGWQREQEMLSRLKQAVLDNYPLPPTSESARALARPVSYFITRNHLAHDILKIVVHPSLATHSKVVGAELVEHFSLTSSLEPDKTHSFLAELRLWLQFDVENVTRM